tara:strand:+ start:50 stop:751 length:702 start_codon:yes stop_codon:yes gene_type:complete
MFRSCQIIGNGFIAKSFKNYLDEHDVIVFASGVSNSTSIEKNDFIREMQKINDICKNFHQKKIIYFSSCSINDKSRNTQAYQKHKISMEKIIPKLFKNYLIVRLPEVVGKNSNPNSLFNFLLNKIKNNKKIITSSKCYRNFIDIDDAKLVVKYLLENKYNRLTINVANISMNKVIDVIVLLSSMIKKNFILEENHIFANEIFKIDIELMKKINNDLKINFNEDYLNRVFSKYI